jgi:hypothetical protein
MMQGGSFVRSVFTGWNEGNDFFQDWASARNVLEGRAAYLPLSMAMSLYYPRTEARHTPAVHLPWNAHPPTSILAILPLGYFDYPAAGTLWNVLGLVALGVSMWLILRELETPIAAWSILPLVVLVLLCSPIRTQVSQGQWNAELLFLLTLAWVADRRGRAGWAGALVGVAGAIKLYPLFFFLHFAIRQRWQSIIAVALVASALCLLSVGILGRDAFGDYFSRVAPTLEEFRSGWPNASLPAFWTKNFSSGATHYGLFVKPVFQAPLLARVGTVLSYACILATWCVCAIRLDRGAARRLDDLSFALALIVMLLLTPICWDHYLLLLMLPLALIWIRLGRTSTARFAFLVLVIVVWLGPNELWKAGGVDLMRDWPDFHDVAPRAHVIRRPLFVLFFLSLHFYALVASYIWMVCLSRAELASVGKHRAPDGAGIAVEPAKAT